MTMLQQRNAWMAFLYLLANVSWLFCTKTITMDLSTFPIVNVVDQQFLSFTIDSHSLVNGWTTVDITNKRIVSLAKHLYPAYLRIGGTDADVIEFVPDLTGSIEKGHETVLVPGKDFLTLANFVKETQVDLIFGLNVLRRLKSDTWNVTNAESLLNFMSSRGIKVSGFELGNEPDSFLHVFNKTVKSPKLASDFGSLRLLLNQYALYKNASVIGPDITRPKGKRSRASRYLRGFLKHVKNNVIDKISFHQYYISGENGTVNDFLNTTVMDNLRIEIMRVKSAVSKFMPGKPIWIGETASGWGGGCPNISDRYASSFLWIDKLGQAARFGIKVVLRQTLVGGNYGLLSLQGYPTPDYFISILHKRLVGLDVLGVARFPSKSVIPSLRIYAHCTSSAAVINGLRAPQGSVTIFGANAGKNDLIITFSKKSGLLIYEYLLQSPDLTSRFAYLNGVKLVLKEDGTLPIMDSVLRRSEIIFPKLSIGFWVVPLANNTECLQNS